MTAKPGLTVRDVKKWMGQPVCVMLKDGSCYVGCITRVDANSILLAGQKSVRKPSRPKVRRAGRARVAGLFPWGNVAGWGGGFGGWGAGPFATGFDWGGLQPGFGQNGLGIGGGGFGGFMGMVKKAWPGIRLGIGMLRTIMPLLGLKI